MHYSAIKIVAVLETAIPAGKESRMMMASFDREDWQAGSLYMADFPKRPHLQLVFTHPSHGSNVQGIQITRVLMNMTCNIVLGSIIFL